MKGSAVITEQTKARAKVPVESIGLSIRVSPNSYFIALLIGTFTAAFLFYIEYDLPAFFIFAFFLILIPLLALSDKIYFDGKRLSRSGLIPNAWSWIYASRRRLKLSDIEQVETQAVRALKRGGNIYYRYRVSVSGKGIAITFASGGDDFRQMVRKVLPLVPENALDTRSIELRDHLDDPKNILLKADFEHIPSADVLRDEIRVRKSVPRRSLDDELPHETNRVEYLRSLGNELRINGFLLQSIEAFRRALVIRPDDGRLIYEFARCMNSFAGVERSKKAKRRALAALILAERRAQDDGDLLARLGEAYSQIGEWRRAADVFQKGLERVGESFRIARGQAEVALNEGKIAHVILQYFAANRLAETPALRRWTKNEAEYFSRLNSDEEYMELEINRVKLVESLDTTKVNALRVTFFGFPAILAGIYLEDTLIANIGWVVSSIGLFIWTVLNVGVRMLGSRIPYDLVESTD